MSYQHLTQKRYLDRWNLTGHLYVIDKATQKATPRQSAKSILGMDDVQTPAMETAFEDVESCIGNLHAQGELTDPKEIRKMAKWVALHAIRTRRHADILATLDYRGDVERLADYFQQHHAIRLDWLDSKTRQPVPAFITCDNPCLYLVGKGVYFWMVPVSPYSVLTFTPFSGYPESPPWDVNKNIVQCATAQCVSFDTSLHNV